MIYLKEGHYDSIQGWASYDNVNVSAPTLRSWILNGTLKSVKLGGAHIIKLEWLEDALAIERRPGPK